MLQAVDNLDSRHAAFPWTSLAFACTNRDFASGIACSVQRGFPSSQGPVPNRQSTQNFDGPRGNRRVAGKCTQSIVRIAQQPFQLPDPLWQDLVGS